MEEEKQTRKKRAITDEQKAAAAKRRKKYECRRVYVGSCWDEWERQQCLFGKDQSHSTFVEHLLLIHRQHCGELRCGDGSQSAYSNVSPVSSAESEMIEAVQESPQGKQACNSSSALPGFDTVKSLLLPPPASPAPRTPVKTEVLDTPQGLSSMKKGTKSTNEMQSLFGSGHLMAKQCGGHVTIVFTDEKKNSIVYTNSDAYWDQLTREGLKLPTLSPGSWTKRVDVVMDSKNNCVLKLREDSAVSTTEPSGNKASNGNTNISHVSGTSTNRTDLSASIDSNYTGKEAIDANMPEVSDRSISTLVVKEEVNSSPVPVARSLNLSGESEHEAGDHQGSESPDIEEMNDNSGPLPSVTSHRNPGIKRLKHLQSLKDVEMMLDNTCPVCKLTFDNREAFTDHTINEKKIRKGKKYPVRVCGSCTICQKSFNDHCDDLLPKKKFVCCQCKVRCYTNVGLKQHTNMHIGEKKYRYLCSVCGKSFFNITQLTVHNVRHKGQHSVTCTVCGKVLQQSSLKDHMMNCHSGVKYPCKLCDRVYQTKKSYCRHYQQAHQGKSEPKPFKCTLCDKRFSASLKLKYHMNVHTGDKPYKCPICDKGFTQEGYVQKHLRLVHKQDLPKKQSK